MNRNEFLNMIENTVSVDRQKIGEVYELIDIFPYFQSAHMLLLRGLQNSADVKFESQLRNSAIHIADREVLYYLLRNTISSAVEQVMIKQDIVLPVVPVHDTEQTVIESAKNSEYLISEIEKNSGETRTNDNNNKDEKSSGHSILISTESNNEDSEGVMLLMDDDPSPAEDKVFYMDPGFSFSGHGDLLELDLDDNSSNSPDKVTVDNVMSGYEDNKANKQLQADLIDKFIITNPRIEPVKDKNNLPVEDISRPFVEGEGGFVTETLARIYVNQGYYSKAIDIYEKLSLKFPEKNSYFASQIEKVKEHIKK